MEFTEEIGRADLFGSASEEQHEWLMDDGLDQYAAWLKATSTSILTQLNAAKDGAPMSDDPTWRRRAVAYKNKVDHKLAVVGPLVKERNRQRYGLSVPREHDIAALLESLSATRRAIHLHRSATLGDDIEPTDADLALWAVVEKEG